MATLQDYRDERLRKLAELKQLGINPYPAQSHRTHNAGDIIANFDELEGQITTIAGRVTGIRKFGKLAFIVIKDFTGSVQLFLRAGDVADLDASAGILGMKELPLLDTGDFLEATGEVIRTKTGEISVGVQKLRLLTKALRPTPTELTSKEERLRRRYVDMSVNQNVRDRFVRRSKFWESTREYLNNNGFIEVNIPVLEHTTGGADANPFVTHMDALDQDFYLRISHELPLKRLLGAGFEKVYDLGPRFRNENYSDEHLPEHVAMEWYWAYANWEQGMQLTQEMVRYIADKTWNTRQFTLMNGMKVDLGADDQDWPRISFVEVIRDRFGIDVFNATLEEVQVKIKENNIELEKSDNIGRCIDKLWKKIRIEINGPAFLVDIPAFLQPLAKLQEKDPRLTEQFNLLLGGTEACKAYSELNDPVDQLRRFVEQQNLRDAGDDEAMMLDIDFVEMLEYGMPPACGYGHAERLFWILEGVTAREGVPFPQLRHEVDEITKSLYPEANLVHAAASKLNILPPTSDRMSEEHRNAYKMVVILNKEIETGRVINAASHAVSGFVGTLHNLEQFDYLEYRDKTGEFDAVISHHPTIILQASNSKDLLKAYRKLNAAHMPNNAFIETMTIGSSQEEIEILQDKTIEDLDFWGIVFFGPTDELQKITKDFQLWK